MNSLIIPSNVNISISNSFLTRTGPKGSVRVPTNGFSFNLLTAPENKYLVVSSRTSSVKTPVSTILSLLSRRLEGISLGYRHRLRLVGVGFRATSTDSSILRKIGYSHDVTLKLDDFKNANVAATPSRLDGRSKGTILQFESNDPSALFHQIKRVQRFRRPDPYKAKGIHVDGQTIRRKKGKREA